jgi:hypothetical protein
MDANKRECLERQRKRKHPWTEATEAAKIQVIFDLMGLPNPKIFQGASFLLAFIRVHSRFISAGKILKHAFRDRDDVAGQHLDFGFGMAARHSFGV